MKCHPSKPKGFTIIELLVVISIILILGASMFAIGSRMLRKSKATLMANNMKQISAFFTAYATDNQQQLLPCRGDVIQADGSVDDEALWHEIILSMMYESVDPVRFKDDDWWYSQQIFLRNPLFTDDMDPRGWSALNPGYGYNLMIPANYEFNENDAVPADTLLELVKVPLAYLDEPTRTPIIAPADNYFYRYDLDQIDEFNTSQTLREFLVDGGIPVLFLDGHMESVRPDEYINRRLHEMPLDPDL